MEYIFTVRNSQWENNNLSLIILYLCGQIILGTSKINTFEDKSWFRICNNLKHL